VTYDVAIIGAGAAGIAAARRLQASKQDVVVLEAAGRAGGRAWTERLAGMPLDLGCGWLHSADRNPLSRLGEACGFRIERGPSAWNDQWRDLGFTQQEQRAARSAWSAFERRLAQDSPASDRASDALDPQSPWNSYFQALSGYINGAELAQLSISDYLAYDGAATDANWRVVDGYGALIAASLPSVTLALSTPVRRVTHGRESLKFETDRGSLTAKTGIVTVSTAVLASGAIRFDPEIGDHFRAAAQLPLGFAEKLFLELHGGHSLEAETHLLGNPRCARTGSYYIMPFGRPVIECYFGGAGAEAVQTAGAMGAFAFAIDELAALLGRRIREHVRPLIGSAWGRMDWVRGSYSHALPGRAGCRAILASPATERLFFAGEATHPTDFSTAHGAWQSGVRAAEEALHMLTLKG